VCARGKVLLLLPHRAVSGIGAGARGYSKLNNLYEYVVGWSTQQPPHVQLLKHLILPFTQQSERMRVLVAVKRVVDYAVKVRVRPDKTGAFKILTQPFVPASTLSHTLSILC
jgi:hypothetical protein